MIDMELVERSLREAWLESRTKPCAVKINTKGHQRRPCRVARSMRRVRRG